jgi:TrmH family RNA methyltransferase
VNPGDMGNLGTIIRTMAGFGVRSLAIITPAADLFDPKTIRASMGAVFRINASLFNSFEAYREMFPDHACFPFMTDGETMLEPEASERLSAYPYTLIFGNEAAGLDTRFKDCGIAVKIPQTGLVDSLNLSVCAGIGLYCFTSLQRQ